ncbi:broad specificity phosphatase PhoE [Microbacterium natoriense]|uniref:Broad specificity phosphatase PhoE n=1 Tax=Microbacterium natoriense TaxID=284570 RepID=A0AAW8EZB8_9MICO|nr:histidine phosphatase family protein [Microbacterium natoriense]MDQ0648592.1 broad specificity phosphatase PhoE [Microbacterium natoriense]
MRLLLVRHGQTPSNVVGALDTGRPGPGLTALGQSQAEAIPGALADQAVDAIYASPLIRTQLTAAPLAGARSLDIEVLEGLEEIVAGRWEMHNDMEAVRAYMETASRWAVGDLDAVIDGGESGHEFFDRYDNAIAKVAAANPAATAVVVSHGAAIRVWAAARIVGVDLSEAAKWRIYNTGMCELDGDPQNGWQLVRWVREPLGGVELEDARALDVDPPALRPAR